MTPRNTIFTREKVIHAALDILKDLGWEAITARNIAQQLGASVAPVYSTFESIKDLQKEILKKIHQSLEEYTRHAFTEIPFLNIGVGTVVFAREEPNSYRALFLYRHHKHDILEKFYNNILSRMKTDEMLQPLPQKSLSRLLRNLWFYSLGLATSVIYDQLDDCGTENIIYLLKNMGHTLIYSELSGLINSESKEAIKLWESVLKEKNITWEFYKDKSLKH